jgi:hypothetical protein
MRESVPRILPASCFDSRTALEVDNVIRLFGNRLGKGEHEIEKCRLLAEGSDDLLILLERPANNHKYDKPFDVFVSGSPALGALDELIRFASNGYRNLRNTTVVDVFTMKPKKEINSVRPSDEECCDLVRSIIQLKQPKVVLGCTAYIWALGLHGLKGVPSAGHVDFGKTTLRFLLVPSLHPAYCVNIAKWCAKSRLALIYHVILAMRCLDGMVEIPTWSSALTDWTFV